MLNKEQLDAIKARVVSANKCGDIAVQVYEEDAPALIAEVERLQQFERKAIYVLEENKRLREALEFHPKVPTMVLGGEVVLMQKSKDKIRIPKSVADAIELFKRSGYDNNEIMEKRYEFSHNGYLIAVLKRVTPAQLYGALTNGYEVTKNE